MDLPEPIPGLVIHYGYLWHSEHRGGMDNARKDRPSAILLASATKSGATRVYALAITHSAPGSTDHAVEIPLRIKRHLGLDSERSWIVLDEVNDFVWPGFDLRTIPGTSPARIDYGVLPPAFFDHIRDAFVNLYRAKVVKSVRRD
jgi:hypothetical protein